MVIRNVLGGILLVVLAACGGSGSDDPPVEPDPPANPDDEFTLVSGFTGDINYTNVFPEQGVGTGADGQGGIAIGSTIGTVRNANVTVYRLSDGTELGQASTGLTGLVTLGLPSDYTDGVIVQLLGTATSDYYDVALNEFRTFPEGFEFRAYVPEIAGNIGVGPVTEAIVSRMVNLLANANSQLMDGSDKFHPDTQSRASELNLQDTPISISTFRQYDIQYGELSNVAAIPGLLAGTSSNVPPTDVVALSPDNPAPAQIPFGADGPLSTEISRLGRVDTLANWGRIYADYNIDSNTPVLDFATRFISDLETDDYADLKIGAQPIGDSAYQQSMTVSLNYGIRNTFSLVNVRYAESEEDQLVSFPDSSYQIFTNGSGSPRAFQALSWSSGTLNALEILGDGSLGELFTLAENTARVTTGFQGFDLAVQPKGDLGMVYFFGDNTNGYLGDITPDASINGIDRFDIQFPSPVTGIFRQINHAFVTTEDFQNTGMLHAFGRAGQGSLFEQLGIPDTPASQPAEVSISDLFPSMLPSTDPSQVVDLWIDFNSFTMLAITRDGRLHRSDQTEAVPLSEFFFGSNTAYAIEAQSTDAFAVSDGTSLVAVDYNNSSMAQQCSAGLSTAGAPFAIVNAAAAILSSPIITDFRFAGEYLYWTTVDLTSNHKSQLWVCGANMEPVLLHESYDPIKLYGPEVGFPNVVYLGITPGPNPENGHTLFPLLDGVMINLLDLPTEPQSMVINANNFSYVSQKRRLATVTLSNGETRDVEYVDYTYTNDTDNQAMIVHTRSDLDPDGGEGVYQVDFHSLDSIPVGPGPDGVVSFWNSNVPDSIRTIFPSDVLGIPGLQVKLPQADIIGGTVEFENLPLKMNYYQDKKVEIDGFVNLPN